MLGDEVVRPNGGRTLVVVIMSGDGLERAKLLDLLHATGRTAERMGLDVSTWPIDVIGHLDGVMGCKHLFLRNDDFGEVHRFALIDLGGFDLLVGVSSRRELNLRASRSGNVATEVILQVLDTRTAESPDEPLYGTVVAYELHRIWRSMTAAMAMHAHAMDWKLVLLSDSDRLDYAVPGTDLMAIIRSSQAAAEANQLVVKGAARKRIAHERGELKYGRGQVHPAVKVDPRTGEMSYNAEVVAVLREVARLAVAGWSWERLAVAYAHHIPAPRATDENDAPNRELKPGRTARTREARNHRRELRGRDALPSRYLDDGAMNPLWRELTVADLDDPEGRLRSLFLRGVTVPTRHSEVIERHVDDDLDGIHPRDASLAFYSDGRYRRLTKDHDRSNSRISRYCWSSCDLGRVDDEGYILDPATVEKLKALRVGRGTGSWGTHPLIGVFAVEVPAPLYTSAGYLDPAAGRFVVRSFSDGTRGLRIWHEPMGTRAKSRTCKVVAVLAEPHLGDRIGQLLIDACTTHNAGASFAHNSLPQGEDPVDAARSRVRELERLHDHLTDRLADPATTPRTAAKLNEQLASVETDLDAAHASLAAAAATEAACRQRYGDSFDITDLADLVALLRCGHPLPPKLADRASRLLRAILPDATFSLDIATGAVRLTATLTLTNEHGQLRVPINGTLDNLVTDTWITGIAVQWWHRHQTIETLFAERGLKTPPGAATRWRAPIIDRLIDEAEQSGRSLAGPNTASILSRAPHPELIRAVVEHVTGAEPTNCRLSAALAAQLVAAGGDPPRMLWTQPGWRELVDLANLSDSA